MLKINPKTLDDAKSIIENTLKNKSNADTWLNKIGLDGVQEAIDNFNNVCNGMEGVFKGGSYLLSFIGKCFTQPHFFINSIQVSAPGVFLVIISMLIILNFLGFKNTKKWIYFAFILALLIAGL